MTLAEAVREAVQSALRSALLPDVIYATYSGGGLVTAFPQRVIPAKNVDIPPVYTDAGMKVLCRSGDASGETTEKELVLKAALSDGDTVAVLMHHDRQRFSILYKV